MATGWGGAMGVAPRQGDFAPPPSGIEVFSSGIAGSMASLSRFNCYV
jgi:hypothetical protein